MTTYPYESQWGDPACNAAVVERGEDPAGLFDWRADGYRSAEEHAFWARHVCGLAGLRSVLRAWIPSAGALPMRELITRAVARGALTRDGDEVGGLHYRPFAEWVRDDFGIEAVVHPRIDVPELLAEVGEGRVVLASVSAEIRYPERPRRGAAATSCWCTRSTGRRRHSTTRRASDPRGRTPGSGSRSSLGARPSAA
jgi:hypothetical protein